VQTLDKNVRTADETVNRYFDTKTEVCHIDGMVAFRDGNNVYQVFNSSGRDMAQTSVRGVVF
jgi:hypothetical protein